MSVKKRTREIVNFLIKYDSRVTKNMEINLLT